MTKVGFRSGFVEAQGFDSLKRGLGAWTHHRSHVILSQTLREWTRFNVEE